MESEYKNQNYLRKFRSIIKKLRVIFLIFFAVEIFTILVYQIITDFENFRDILLPMLYALILIICFFLMLDANIVGRNLFIAIGYVKIFLTTCFLLVDILIVTHNPEAEFVIETVICETLAFILGTISVIIPIRKLKTKKIWDLFQKSYSALMEDYLNYKQF